jgi:hypothetical protein
MGFMGLMLLVLGGERDIPVSGRGYDGAGSAIAALEASRKVEIWKPIQ